MKANVSNDGASPWETLADGDYAIVELFGHTTLVGRIQEVERFGAKMMAIEPLFAGKLMGPIYHGGAAIYRLSPCSREIAWNHQHEEAWQLPPTIRAMIPAELLAAPEPAPSSGLHVIDNDDDPFAPEEDDGAAA